MRRNPFAWAPVVLITGIPPDECCSRLKESVASSWSFDFPAPVVGMVAERRFRLRRRIWYRNSFQAIAAGTLEESGPGTRIRCEFRMNLFVQAFMVVWLCGAVLISGGLAVSTIAAFLRTGDGGWNALVAVCFASIFPIFGAGLLAFGRWLARDERAFLIGHIRTNLEAQIED